MPTTQELARKHVRLSRAGGSRKLVLPKEWLDAHGIGDEVDLVLTPEAIMVVGPRPDVWSIEDDPDFARFLVFLAKDAVRNPGQLGDIGELMAGDDELFAGIEPD